MRCVTDPWHILGIAATRDAAAIRKAYAAELKRFDMDQEPNRYITLRDARDLALRWARSAHDTLSRTDPSPSPETVAPIAEQAIAEDVEPSPLQRETEESADPGAPPVDDVGFHYSEMMRLLLPDGERSMAPLSFGERTALADHFAALLHDPRMELVSFRMSAEAQLRDVIAGTIPRSDAILLDAVDFFGWEETRGRVDQPRGLDAVLHRATALRFIAKVQSPAHPMHKAWRELTSPVVKRGRRAVRVGAGDITTLLRAIRIEQPALESELDPERVAMWEGKLGLVEPGRIPGGVNRPGSGGLRLWLVVGFFALVQLSAIGSNLTPKGGGTPPNEVTLSTAPANDDLRAPATDLDPVLTAFAGDGFTMHTISIENPVLFQLLTAKWQQAHDDLKRRSAFSDEISTMLVQRLQAAISIDADPALVVDYRRLQLEEAKGIRESGFVACDSFFATGDAPPQLGYIFRDRRWRARQQILMLSSPDTVPEDRRRLAIPDEVMAVAAARLKLPPAQFERLLDAGGMPGQRCDARIALIETGLALPQEIGLPLLRRP
jgi:hypothetical protein